MTDQVPPRFIAPMLARSGAVPDGDGWAIEVKFDGMRGQLRVDGRSLCVRSRPGRNCTGEFPELAPIGRALGRRSVILDGELVCFGPDGKPDFQRLRGRLQSGRRSASAALKAPATFLAFDVVHLDGRSTLALPYTARRELLVALELDGPAWRTAPSYVGATEAMVAFTSGQDLEGVVAKRLDSPYLPGVRTACWVKHKHRRRETMAITAWAPAQPRRPETFFLTRQRTKGELEPAGSVSFGLAADARDELRARLQAAELPHRRRNQRVRAVDPPALVEVDCHGPRNGPVRDAVLRAVST